MIVAKLSPASSQRFTVRQFLRAQAMALDTLPAPQRHACVPAQAIHLRTAIAMPISVPLDMRRVTICGGLHSPAKNHGRPVEERATSRILPRRTPPLVRQLDDASTFLRITPPAQRICLSRIMP